MDAFNDAGHMKGVKVAEKSNVVLVPQPSDDPKDPLVRFPSGRLYSRSMLMNVK